MTTNGNVSTFDPSSATNRLPSTPAGAGSPYASYDSAGRVTSLPGGTFTYDPLDSVIQTNVGGNRIHLYTASDERIATIALDPNTNAMAGSDWTIRDPSGKVLTRFKRSATGAWSWDEDYIYRDGQLLATEVASEHRTLHFHNDHLGTPRLITNHMGAKVALHTYAPFGGELSSTAQDTERLKFTGHERDHPTLDSMHARYYLPGWGRFLSVDPHLDIEKSKMLPQRWNRYAYVMNSPLRYTDPNGRDEREGWKAGVVVNHSSQPVMIAGDVNGRVQVAQLQPGQTSTSVMQDADAIIPNNQTMSFGPIGIPEVPVIKDGALKVGFGKVTVSDSSTTTLKLSGTIGYILSVFGLRAGVVPPSEAQKNQWVVPQQQQQTTETQTPQTQTQPPQQQQSQPQRHKKKTPEEERVHETP